MRDLMFRILYTAQDGSKTLHYADDEKLMIGLNGKVYENYGTKKNQVWQIPFDVAEPPIVQQSTECRDKNKMLIYEGDTISYRGEIGTVRFFAGMFIVEWKDQTDNELAYMAIDEIEIVKI